MTESQFYQKLVDLYVGEELPQELMEELERVAQNHPGLAEDMRSLKDTVMALRSMPVPRFGEESFHRILFKLYGQGTDLEIQSPSPTYLQYQLPMTG